MGAFTSGQYEWGCTRYPDRRKPKHLIDPARSERENMLIGLCGEFLHYRESDTVVREGDPCSGRTMLEDRLYECKWCRRAEVERTVTLVALPVEYVAAFADRAPRLWDQLSLQVDATVASAVNALRVTC